MSLIRQILDEVKGNGGVINLDELSRRVKVEPAALRGILAFCAQKGYLTPDSDAESGCGSCAASLTGCPWVSAGPTCYRLKQHG